MMKNSISLQSRDSLFKRHHLSHQQIDWWLDEKNSKDYLPEKLTRLEAVKNFLDITDKLREKHVSFTCIKGPLLSYRIYGDASVRFSHDIDLLISPEQLPEALSLLLKDGYICHEGFVWPENKVRQELLLQSSHHLSLTKKMTGSVVELHWSLMNALPISQIQMNKLIQDNLTSLDFAGRKFTLLNKELELLYLMIHGAKHGWSRLKWLVDIKDYPIADFHSEYFMELVYTLKADRILGQTNLLLQQYFDRRLPFEGKGKVPTFFIDTAQKSIVNDIEAKFNIRYLIQSFVYNSMLFPDWSYKARMIGQIAFCQGDVVRHSFSSKLAYAIYRPYSLFKRRKFHA